MFRTLFLTLFFLTIGLSSQATHMSGGDIYWECIGPNQYRIIMVIYRDCFGIEVDPTYNLVLTSPCGNRNLTVSTPGGREISQLCDIELPNSTCNGGVLPGIQEYIYTGTITLPPCDSWTVSYTNIYRNGAIVNLTNPGQQRTYIRAVMNTADSPCNDSPKFTNTAIPYVCTGYPVTYSFGAYDPENDSLSYELIPAMGIAGAPLNYVNPHSGAQPIPGLTLDPITGEVNFTLNTIGNWVVVVRVNHWVNGQLVGSVMRDMQFVSYPCDNIPPDPSTGLVQELSGTATQTGPRAVEVCESGDFCFDMVISDPNAGDALSAFSNVGQSMPGATFNYTGTNPITATICWTAQPGTSGFFPFIVNVSDGACPIPAFQTYVYAVRVIPGLSATLEVVDESCLGAGDGSITAVVTTGSAPYSYAWNNGGSEASITGGPGEHTVVIEDDNGCVSHPLTATISSSGLPSEADAGDDMSGCAGLPVELNGTVQNASGGEWSGGEGTFNGSGLNVTYIPSQADLAAGGVTLTLTTTGNAQCPPAMDEVFITLVDNFTDAQVTATDATCHDAADGIAVFTPDLPGSNYLWDDPSGQASAVATGLLPGDYHVTVTDASGCSITLDVTIGAPAPISITDLSSTDESCLGDGNGTATVSVTGGTAPYMYTWSTGATDPVITASSGTYTVSVTDANGCTPAEGDVTIDPEGLPNEAHTGPGMVGCLNSLPLALNGTVVNASGGEWSGGEGTFSGSWPTVLYMPTASEVQAGVVELMLTTTGNTVCPPASETVLVPLSNAFLDARVDVTHATCSDADNGSAVFGPDEPGLDYLWDAPGAQTTAMATGLPAGTYHVTVTDVLGCDTTLSAVIGPPGPIAILDITSSDESCLGDGNGHASVTVTGGTAPYIYTWSTGDDGTSITAVSGTYTVSITDANGCAPAQGEVTIGAQGLPNMADAGNDIIGCLNSLPVAISGSVANATGGTWSGGNGAFLGTGLNVSYMPSPAEVQAGSVELVLTTTGNTVCATASDTMTITLSNSFLQASLTATDISCNGVSDGTATFTPDTPGATYLWNDPASQTTATAIGLGPGLHTVLVTDHLGCDTALSVTITEPEPLSIIVSDIRDVTCHAGNDGGISLSIAGGTPGYSVLWDNGMGGTTISGLSAGDRSATVTDAHGCSEVVPAMVGQPDTIALFANVPDTVCVNSTVTLSASASGGTGPLTISWGPLGTGESIETSFSTSQTVNVTVSDALGCSGPALSMPVHVLDLPNAMLITYGDTTTCPGGSATVKADVFGYTGAYTMVWPQLGAFGKGPFTLPIPADIDLIVQVSDACANSLEGLVALRLEEPPSIALPPVIAEGCAPLTVEMPDLGPPPGTHLQWDLGNGSTSNATTPVVTYPAGAYTVTLTASSPLGCTTGAHAIGQVVVHQPPTAAFSASPWTTDLAKGTIAFSDASTGQITTHDWWFGDGGSSNSANPAHLYTEAGTFMVDLWVMDNHGCTDSVSHPVTITPVHDITFPTAFTPDPNGGNGGAWDPNDLSNDVFYPFARSVQDFRMRIFNRWGELIFESDDIRIGWDGYYRGQLSPQDVYVVQAWFRFVDGKEIERLSDLTLLR